MTRNQDPPKRKRLPKRGRVSFGKTEDRPLEERPEIPGRTPRPKPGEPPSSEPITIGLFDPDA